MNPEVDPDFVQEPFLSERLSPATIAMEQKMSGTFF
jgi:hypothetical protein